MKNWTYSYQSYPYKVEVKEHILDATQWCIDNYGKHPNNKWTRFGANLFAFKESKEAMWFSLKWQ